MRPAGRIDLAGRDADGTQGSYAQHALLATATYTRSHGGQWAGGAGIGGLIGGLLVAPVVDFEHGIVHGEAFHAAAERVGPGGAESVEVLVVDAGRQYEVAELTFRHVPPHLAARLQGGAYLAQPVVEGVHGHVGQRQIAVKELGVGALVGREVGRGEWRPYALLKLGQ